MVKKNTLFDFMSHVMVTWGVTMLFICIFCKLFGADAKGVSSMFALGDEGVPFATAMQFLGISVVITLLRWIFFTDKILKEAAIVKRSIMMFATVIVTVGIFAGVFGWFPVNQVKPWIMFFVSFFLCAFCAVMISVMKEKAENLQMEKALERMKKEVSKE